MKKEFRVIKDLIISNTGVDFTIKSRKSEVVKIRSIYFKLCKEYTAYSLEVIGQSMSLDHATVTHSLSKFNKYMGKEPNLLRIYSACRIQVSQILKREMVSLMNKETKMLHQIISLKGVIQDLNNRLNRIPISVQLKYL